MWTIIYYFKTWFFAQLPGDFKENDTYVDLSGQGLLERYLSNFGMELDENVKPYIDNFMDLFDAAKCQKQLLTHLSFMLGSPISLDNSEAVIRKVLQYAVTVYKWKGTIRSYEMLFNFIGIEIAILEDTPGKQVTYDADPVFLYDDGNKYDTGCADCSGYTIAYNLASDPGNTGAVTPALLAIAQQIICFLQPINATFNGFIARVNITETMPITIDETSSVEAFLPVPGEFADDFDTINDFD